MKQADIKVGHTYTDGKILIKVDIVEDDMICTSEEYNGEIWPDVWDIEEFSRWAKEDVTESEVHNV